MARYQGVWRKLIGVEMEAAGVAATTSQSAAKPGFFMVRCVSDLADEQKGSAEVEQWRPYACEVAASFAIALLKSGPVSLNEAVNLAVRKESPSGDRKTEQSHQVLAIDHGYKDVGGEEQRDPALPEPKPESQLYLVQVLGLILASLQVVLALFAVGKTNFVQLLLMVIGVVLSSVGLFLILKRFRRTIGWLAVTLGVLMSLIGLISILQSSAHHKLAITRIDFLENKVTGRMLVDDWPPRGVAVEIYIRTTGDQGWFLINPNLGACNINADNTWVCFGQEMELGPGEILSFAALVPTGKVSDLPGFAGNRVAKDYGELKVDLKSMLVDQDTNWISEVYRIQIPTPTSTSTSTPTQTSVFTDTPSSTPTPSPTPTHTLSPIATTKTSPAPTPTITQTNTPTLSPTTNPPRRPAAPSNLSATAVSRTEINLSWIDNSTNETGFKIERCDGSGCTVFTEIGAIGANAMTYQDGSRLCGETYAYRVRAYNANGDSPYSAPASAGTHPCPTERPTTPPIKCPPNC